MELTPNRMACNAVPDALITEFKSSPKSPTESSRIEKKKLLKKKMKRALRQRTRLSSQSSERSNASQQQVGAPYNLIEFCGDRSRSESANGENVVPYNQSGGTASAASAIISGSGNLSDPQAFITTRVGEFGAAGVSVHQTSKKVIFMIPEGWASSIEIMRLPMSLSHNSSSSVPPYEQQTNSVGPVRSKERSYRKNRNTPYCSSSRRGKQSYYAGTRDRELMSSAGRSNARDPTFPENMDFDRCYTAGGGYRYESRDYEQTSSSIGPIRRSGKRKAFYTPYGSAAREMTNYNSLDSASSPSTSDSYKQTNGSPYYSGRKNYKYSDNYKSIRCWHCQRRGHIRINCPSRMTHTKY